MNRYVGEIVQLNTQYISSYILVFFFRKVYCLLIYFELYNWKISPNTRKLTKLNVETTADSTTISIFCANFTRQSRSESPRELNPIRNIYDTRPAMDMWIGSTVVIGLCSRVWWLPECRDKITIFASTVHGANGSRVLVSTGFEVGTHGWINRLSLTVIICKLYERILFINNVISSSSTTYFIINNNCCYAICFRKC